MRLAVRPPGNVITVAEIHFDNVDSILSQSSELTDPRSHVNRIHFFGDLIVICIMAVIAGADGPQASRVEPEEPY